MADNMIRDKLAADLTAALDDHLAVYCCADHPRVLEGVFDPTVPAGHLLAKGWRPPARVITSTEELDALQPAKRIVEHWDVVGRRPEAAVIRDARGWVLDRDCDNAHEELREGRRSGWWATGTDRDDIDSASTDLVFPVTVLWEPEVDRG